MTVLTRVLFGLADVEAYDWQDRTNYTADKVRNQTVQPGEIFTCHPDSGGNIHSITARKPFAMLDVIIPPYSAERECQYYRVQTWKNTFRLKPIVEPYFVIEPEPYVGFPALDTL
eukprot:c4729_g1_i2.p1 GENE.c4729_g1_i2~~c4729_g1_i2.p1  ORF type:complete len:115 (-),score=20.60 c4729_g1_i2:16-360(-)